MALVYIDKFLDVYDSSYSHKMMSVNYSKVHCAVFFLILVRHFTIRHITHATTIRPCLFCFQFFVQFMLLLFVFIMAHPHVTDCPSILALLPYDHG